MNAGKHRLKTKNRACPIGVYLRSSATDMPLSVTGRGLAMHLL